MPEELTKIIHDILKDAEIVELLRKLSGVDPLPAR
jgi:hypothetical protein